MALTIQDIIDNIAEVIQGMDGEAIAQLHNSICSNKIEYKGDSIFEESASLDLIQFLQTKEWKVESYWGDNSELEMFKVITPEGEEWDDYLSESDAWNDILDQDLGVAKEWEHFSFNNIFNK